jgi:hypothetical protein
MPETHALRKFINNGIDGITNAHTIIDYAHHEVHGGSSFTTEFADNTMANAETIIIVFKTMAGTKKIHMLSSMTTLVGGSLQIWEGATWTTNTGALLPIINRKRETTMASSGILEDLTATPAFTETNNMLVNPTGLNIGAATSIHLHYAYGERGKIGAGTQRDIDEYILKPETQYAIVFTAIGASNKGQIILNWYEHTDT